MAEKVRVNMEHQLAELRDLKERNLFDQQELNTIVKRRTAFESAVHAKTVQPQDYLNYVSYESSLDSLRAIRAKKQKSEQQQQQQQQSKGKGKQQQAAGKNKTKKKFTLSDYSLARRQTKLLQMATRRFPTNELLWDTYLAHLRTIRPFPETDLSKAHMASVAAMPLSAKYWIQAALFESRANDGHAARKMFMRAARVCGDVELWGAWIRFEVGQAADVRARWRLLGLLDGSDAQHPQTEGEDNAVLQGQIVKVVIDHALEKHPEAHLNFARSIQDKPSELSPVLLDHLYAHLPDHSELRPTWSWTTLSPTAAAPAKIEALHNSVEGLKAAKQYTQLQKFLQERLDKDASTPELTAYLQAQLDKANKKLAKVQS